MFSFIVYTFDVRFTLIFSPESYILFTLMFRSLIHFELIFVYGYNALLEKVMAPHSSTLAWKIPWTEEPGRLQSMGWLRVGHD